MDSERFARIKKLFLAARELPADERERFLTRECGGDVNLRREVESLLTQGSGSFDILRNLVTEEMPGDTTGGRPTSAAQSVLPDHIGSYRILEVIGEGGMGTVYRALQEAPIRREVALKSIRAGLDSPSVRARFESERQVLALMDHPNIARVLDAGSDESGHPYFVMELVRGLPITRHAADRNLSTRDRLDLFLRVCRAVQDAHAKGIIHRDLKPSNIIVTSHDGLPDVKIIDFGIAKASEEALAELPTAEPLTEEGRLVGTLDYMSPEQTRGVPGRVDVRGDVYSLGVVLYELLANAPPYRVQGLPMAEALRIITTAPPPAIQQSPTGHGRLPEDLNIIVRKALEKDPDRRYDTAAQLADDVDRFLRSEPILARPPSAAYQLRMLARRNQTAVALASAAAVFLVVLAAVMSLEAAAQRHERLRAEREAEKATRTNAFLQNMLRSASPGEKHLDVQVREVLDDAARELNFGSIRDPEIEAALRRTIGNTYVDLGDYRKARVQLERALELRRRALGPRDPLVAESLYDLAALYVERGADPAGLSRADSLCEMARTIRASTPGEESVETAESLEQAARIRFLRSDIAPAESLLTRAISIFRKVQGEASPQMIRAYSLLARIVNNDVPPRIAEAESLLQRSLVISRTLYPGDHPEVARVLKSLEAFMNGPGGSPREADSLAVIILDMERRMYGDVHPQVADALVGLGHVRINQGRTAEAESLFTEAFRIGLQVYGEGSQGAADAYGNLALAQWANGKTVEAERDYRRALSILRNQEYETWDLGMTMSDLALVLNDERREEEALAMQQEALGVLERVWGPEHNHVAICSNNIGVTLLQKGRYAEAEPYLSRATFIWSKLYRDHHPMNATAANNLGYLLDCLGRHEEAEIQYRKSAAIHELVAGGDTWNLLRLIAYGNFGNCLAFQGRYEEAETKLRRTVAEFERSIGKNHPRYGWALGSLGSILVERGKLAEADSLLRAALDLTPPKDTASVAWVQNSLATCLASQGRRAAADSLFGLNGSLAWTHPRNIPPLRDLARERAERYWTSFPVTEHPVVAGRASH